MSRTGLVQVTADWDLDKKMQVSYSKSQCRRQKKKKSILAHKKQNKGHAFRTASTQFMLM